MFGVCFSFIWWRNSKVSFRDQLFNLTLLNQFVYFGLTFLLPFFFLLIRCVEADILRILCWNMELFVLLMYLDKRWKDDMKNVNICMKKSSIAFPNLVSDADSRLIFLLLNPLWVVMSMSSLPDMNINMRINFDEHLSFLKNPFDKQIRIYIINKMS